jgi:WXXGXW repeat (2 copies)
MQLFRSYFARLVVLSAILLPSAVFAQVAVGVSITVAPPALPVYVQPTIPAPGYIWTPGYWAYGPEGYYWVPGTWIQPPVVGVLWTPGYWGWREGIYLWNAGYWGPRIGYYGGINYGYGYVGVGYAGGYWRGGVFSYNRTVNNFGGVTINNTYNKTVINNTNVTQTSYNGGAGGASAQPTPQELAAANDQHTPPTAAQSLHQQNASTNRSMLASVNNGKPAIAATSQAGHFTGSGVVAAKNVNTGTETKNVNGASNKTPTSLSNGNNTSKANTGETGTSGSGSKNFKGRTASAVPHPAKPAPKPRQ